MRGVLLVLGVLGVCTPAGGSTRLLDVPFVPQSEELCGGAAVAMVMRYWASTDLSAVALAKAEDFAALVDKRAGGISVGALARAVKARGWQAHAFAATTGDVQASLSRGQPVIALIEDRAPRLHYVVVVAWTNDRVVFHDPAVNPFRSLEVTAFERAWQVTGRTALLVLPPASGDAQALARSAGVARNQAGAMFLEKRYGDAATLAALTVEQNPDDLASWQLLAASRFLEGDPEGALDAWNRRGEPRVDLATVDGLSRTRYDVVAGLLDLAPNTLLTRDALARASRRVDELPSAHVTRLRYSPRENGTATVDVAVVERPVLPVSRAEIAAAAVYAATMREARVHLASPTGNGELWTASARWWSGRPRVGLALALPTVGKWTGLWRLESAWEKQTYRLATSDVERERRRGSVSFGDWSSGRVRWQLGIALDRWNSDATYASILGQIGRRFLDDHLALGFESQAASGFGTAAVSVRWRSSREPMSGWRSTAGMSAVTRTAPLDLWPGGDTGVVRSTLLRAHPLLNGEAIRASALRTALPHASMEYQRRIAVHPIAQLGWAAFVDATSAHVDAGVGVRVRMPAAPGLLRIDVARGLRDGRVALSAGWQPAW